MAWTPDETGMADESDAFDFRGTCRCSRKALEACCSCGAPLCGMCFETGGGFCGAPDCLTDDRIAAMEQQLRGEDAMTDGGSPEGGPRHALGQQMSDRLARDLLAALTPYEAQQNVAVLALAAVKGCAAIVLAWVADALPAHERAALLADFCQQVREATEQLLSRLAVEPLQEED